MNHKSPKFFASCPQFLEPLLAEELKAIGISEFFEEKGGMEFKSSDEQALNFLLSTRIGSRVYKYLWGFSIQNEKEIYSNAREINWNSILDPHQTFKITTLLDREANSFFNNSLFLSRLLKDSLVDSIRDKKGIRPSVDIKNPDLSFLMRISKGFKKGFFQVDILLDLCGESLSNRHYRSGGHSAPLRENLAAALVIFSDFNPQSDVFIDSMCGTGTILIEAALIKGNIAPCFFRIQNKNPFSFLNHNWFKKSGLGDFYQNKINATLDVSRTGLDNLPINQFFGFEKDNQTLSITKRNLENCRLSKVIKIEKGDATKISPPVPPPGIIICNPPYGERMGEEEEVANLMYEYGENLKTNFKGYRAYILTLAQMRKKISLSSAQRIPLKNGNIECQLVKYNLY
jgi:23S rRNA G2445 N2-methylase RlmL